MKLVCNKRLVAAVLLALFYAGCAGRPQPMGENVWRAAQHAEGQRAGR
ncbi:MAG: hypothetical protein KYX69_19630 [Sphingomonas sp.]|nr:hypothetical protein [Sphingomonas sp.]MDK2769915.1 hypothetical protein [Sphingomonas sp.]